MEHLVEGVMLNWSLIVTPRTVWEVHVHFVACTLHAIKLYSNQSGYGEFGKGQPLLIQTRQNKATSQAHGAKYHWEA